MLSVNTCQRSLKVVHARIAVETGLDVARLGDLAEVHLDEVAVLGSGGDVGRAAPPPPGEAAVATALNAAPGVILAPPAHCGGHSFILSIIMIMIHKSRIPRLKTNSLFPLTPLTHNSYDIIMET